MGRPVKRRGFGVILFVTGTDTGVGKTVLTCALVRHLQSLRLRVAALKPFSSGGRNDAIAIQKALGSGNSMGLDEINPVWIPTPMAPGAVTSRTRDTTLKDVVSRIHGISCKNDITVVEGIGGLCVPLQGRSLVVDLINALKCEVIVVARNALGTLNHTILTARELKRAKQNDFVVVLMNFFANDVTTKTNRSVLRKLLGKTGVFDYPDVTNGGNKEAEMRAVRKILKKALARCETIANVWPRCCDAPETKTSAVRNGRRAS